MTEKRSEYDEQRCLLGGEHIGRGRDLVYLRSSKPTFRGKYRLYSIGEKFHTMDPRERRRISEWKAKSGKRW